MGNITASVELPANPEKVWAALTDPSGFEKWLTIHTKWKGEVPAEFTEGTEIAEVVTMLGMANTITWKVEKVDAPKELVISGTGMAGVKVSFVFRVEPLGEGSRAVINADFSGNMVVGALGKAVEKDGKKNVEASLANFAKLVAA